MKRKYSKPEVKQHSLHLQHHLLDSSFIPAGGEGDFDVKDECDFSQDTSIWEADW